MNERKKKKITETWRKNVIGIKVFERWRDEIETTRILHKKKL